MSGNVYARKEFKTCYTEKGVGLVWLTVTAEIESLSGQAPYFGLTCWYKGTRGYEGGGADHDLIVEHFPELKTLVKWHLCSTEGPMHYLANSRYWAGFLGYCDGKAGSPPNIDYLKSTCVYGALPEDQYVDLSQMDDPALTEWLKNRLPALIDQFLREMVAFFGDQLQVS